MKLFLIALAAILVGHAANGLENDFDDVEKNKNQCKLTYDTCKDAAMDADAKKLCYEDLQMCLKKAEGKESKEVESKDGKPHHGHHRHHGHHGHHGHHHRHHHRRPKRMCPKHFCKCFKELVKCFRKLHNKTMTSEGNDTLEADYNEQYFEDESPRDMGKGDPPMVSPIAEVFMTHANNGSKGNGTKACFKAFKGCLMKRPGKEMGKDDMDESEKDDDDDDDDDDEMKKPMEGKGPWKKFGGKLKKMYGKIDKKPKGLFTGIWNKMKSFGKKVASKFRGKFGKKPRFGMYRHHHRRRPHHHHGPPPPFRRCMFFARICKKRAGRSKPKMKACAKRFAKCILGACKRFKA